MDGMLSSSSRHARARLDTKQVDRFEALFQTRIPSAESIMVVYHYRVVACCLLSAHRSQQNGGVKTSPS
jgi:hypothetical protein